MIRFHLTVACCGVFHSAVAVIEIVDFNFASSIDCYQLLSLGFVYSDVSDAFNCLILGFYQLLE